MIGNIPMPGTDVQDKTVWKYTASGKFYLKTTTWANNDKLPPHPRFMLLNHI